MPNHGFNWSFALEGRKPEDFLKGGDSLWGVNQGKDNEGRQHWVKFLQRFSGREPMPKVAEIGFGAGVCYQAVQEAGLNVDYYGLDVTPEFCTVAATNFPKLHVCHINGFDIPFDDKFFDIVYARHVLEHQQDFRWQLREMFRVARDYVFLTFFLPLTNAETHDIHWDNFFYHNRYSRKLFLAFCDKRGWEPVEEKMYVKCIEDVDYVDQVIVLRRK